jgi:hypothetical protein
VNAKQIQSPQRALVRLDAYLRRQDGRSLGAAKLTLQAAETTILLLKLKFIFTIVAGSLSG